MTTSIGLVPRYRDYASKAEVIKGYMDGHDFTIMDVMSKWNTLPASRNDIAPDYDQVKLRYKKRTMAVIIDAKTGKEIK